MGKLSHIKKAIDGAKRRVYQGSPHKYDGKLDHSKIGTGEGAQAYGYGHYLAENPSVAKQYQGALSYKELVNNFRKDLPDDAGFDELLEMAQSGKFTDYQNDVIKALADDDWLGFDYPSQAITAAFRDLDNYDPSPALRRAIEGSGHFYEFDIPESAIDNMLDWDAPLSEQSENVKRSIEGLISALSDNDFGYAKGPTKGRLKAFVEGRDVGVVATGEDLYRALADYGGDAREGSEIIKGAGIPGIKYHDGMSRAAGEGTRNFVIFPGNEDMVKAVSRNGEKLSAAALAPLAGIGLMGTFSEDSQAGVGGTIKAAGKALDMSDVARTQRARDMGFDTDATYYHGTRRDFDEFKASNPRGAIGNKKGVYFTKDKRTAEEYSLGDGEDYMDDKSRIMEVYLKNPEAIDTYGGPEYFIEDPSHIRSVNAAFDPAKKDSANLLASMGGTGVLGAAALSPEDARAAELDAIALHGEPERGWRPTEKRNKWKAIKSGLYDNLVAPALEGMAAVNRGAVDTVNFVGPDQVNAILQLSGSEKRVPTLNDIPGIDEATAGNYMQKGLPRDIVRTGGEFLSPL